MSKEKEELLKKLSDTQPVTQYDTGYDRLRTPVLSMDYKADSEPEKAFHGLKPEPDEKTFRGLASTRGVLIEKQTASAMTVRTDSTMRKPEFIEALTKMLNMYYKNVELQVIKPLSETDSALPSITRIPVSIAYFLHGENQDIIGRIFIKDYKNNEKCKRKDLVIPRFLAELGIPVASLLGYDLKEEDYPHRYAILKEPSFKNKVMSHQAGEENYSHLLKILNNEKIMLTARSVVELMAEMQAKATHNIDMLESKYGLELEDTDHDQLIEERFLQHIRVSDERLIKGFKSAYSLLKNIEGENNLYFVQGDFTPNNVRRGSTIYQYFILDYELARKGAFITDDLAMFSSCVARAKPHSFQWQDISKKLQHDFRKKFNEASMLEGLATQLTPKVMNAEMMIETLRAQLYKLGDQVWTQEKAGESQERKNKAIYHFEQYKEVSSQAKELFGGERARLIDELERKVVALVKASPKLGYLKPLTE